MIHLIKMKIKFWWQRRTRGFDDSELWNLDYTIAKFIGPRLRAYKELNRCGVPRVYPSHWSEEATVNWWEHELETIARAFELLVEEDVSYSFSEENAEVIKKGLKLFAKRFNHLWD